MSYSYSGHIAGLGLLPRRHIYGFRGFGDAASDYTTAQAAYLADHAAWVIEKAQHDQDVAAYAGMSAGAQSGYQVDLNNYARALAAYNSAYATYNSQVLARLKQQQANMLARAKATALAKSQGAVIPTGYSGCVTQEQHDNWYDLCNTPTVKGYGALPTGPNCALASLAVCPPALSSLVAPVKPTVPTAPAALTPPAALRAEPQPPTPPAATPIVVTTPAPKPQVTTAPSPTPPSYVAVPNPSTIVPPPVNTAPAPAKKSGGLLSNGLLLVVVGVGGYALYRTFRKPKSKPAAA